jgi:hypothetical protein
MQFCHFSLAQRRPVRAPVDAELERLREKLFLRRQQSKRPAGFRIMQHTLDEARRVGAPVIEL